MLTSFGIPLGCFFFPGYSYKIGVESLLSVVAVDVLHMLVDPFFNIDSFIMFYINQ